MVNETHISRDIREILQSVVGTETEVVDVGCELVRVFEVGIDGRVGRQEWLDVGFVRFLNRSYERRLLPVSVYRRPSNISNPHSQFIQIIVQVRSQQRSKRKHHYHCYDRHSPSIAVH